MINKIKKAIFFLIMLLLPILFFVMLEGALRLIGYGDSFELVRTEKIFDKERFILNETVAQRYFNLPKDKIPKPQPEYFDIEKPKKLLRLFAVGGSSTAGFPFEMNATFPYQLQYRLRNGLFDSWAEVINTGMAAVNSYTVLDLMPEILEHQPDGIVVYMGHNEFYGALGVGSTQNVGNNRTLIKWYIELRKFRTFQLLQNIINRFSGSAVGEGENRRSMMLAMASEQRIPLNSSIFKTAVENYKANLTEIVQLAKNENVPIFLCTLVSNLKDHSPFLADFNEKLSESDRRDGEMLLNKAESEIRNQNFGLAENALSELTEIDSTHAYLHFLQGELLFAIKDTLAAKKAYQKAKDYDLLRFRAPEVFNTIIKEVAQEMDVPLVDVNRIFEIASATKIPDSELFLEHLHPNFDGYRLIAQSVYDALRKIQILNPPKPIAYNARLFSDVDQQKIVETYKKDNGGVTNLDLAFGEIKNYFLTNRWPFPERDVDIDDYVGSGDKWTRQVAINRFVENTEWQSAHYELANMYLKNNELEKALQEFRAVRLRFTEDPLPLIKMGDIAMAQEQYQRANTWYTNGLKNKPNDAGLLLRLSRLYIKTARFKKALPKLGEALVANKSQNVFTKDDLAEIYYLKAASHANLSEFQNAKTALQEALKILPNYPAALRLAEQIAAYVEQN